MLWPPKLSKSLFFLAALTAICYTSTSFAEEVNDSPSNSFLDSAKQVAEGSEVKTPEPQADAPDVPRHPETAAKDKTHSSKVPVRTSDSQRSLLLALENFANGSAEKKSKDGGADGKEIYTKLVSTAAVGLGLFFWLQSRVKSSTFGSVLRKLLTLVIILLVAVGALSTLNGSSFRLRGDPTTGQKGLLDIFSSSQAQQYHRIDQYNEKFDRDRDVQMVNDYYTVSTDFYEYGWSDSFHFAHTLQNETFQDSLVRQEERIAIELGLKKGMRVLDLGSGVGGPARNIAKFSQAEVVGITINEYQVERSRQLTAQAGLTDLVSFVQGDYTDMHAIPDASFDHAYAIEATCHAPRLVDVYREAYRVLKPGGYLGSYEWLTTPTYDRSDPAQRKAVHDIEYGVGLPPLRNFSDVVAVAKEVGFEMIRDFDLRSLEDKEHVKTKPWYYRMDMNYLSYYATHITCYITETLGLAPKGTVATHAMLMHGLDGLVGCGKLGCFTPMHWVLMRKPL